MDDSLFITLHLADLAPLYLLMLLGAYLLGSVSSAVLWCGILNLPDPRLAGSGNPGATNVMRLGGLRAAALTLSSDLGKGLVFVLLAKIYGAPPMLQALIGLAAVLGHLFPVFFQFKGGKGVATGFGVMLALDWHIALLQLLVWLLVVWRFQVSALAALITALVSPLLSLWLSVEILPVVGILSLLLILRHHRNIRAMVNAGTLSR